MAENWKVDKYGRRYKEENGCIEYEMEILTTGGSFSAGQLDQLNKMKKENLKTTTMNTAKTCPFGNGMRRNCRKECAFYDDAGCMKYQGDTVGRRCPLNPYLCDRDCVFYDSGCKLTRAMREVLK